MVLPVIVLPVAAGAAGYGCARVFNWSQNAAADRVHGSRQKQGATATCSYPWPPNAFSEYPAHSNSTVAGNLVGVLSFVVAFRLQRRYVFQGLANALAQGAPGGTGVSADLSADRHCRPRLVSAEGPKGAHSPIRAP